MTKANLVCNLVVLFMVIGFSASSLAQAPLQERNEPWSDATTSLMARFGNDCRDVDMVNWSHPTRDIFEASNAASLIWLRLCEKDIYAVFGAKFRYDPQGQANDLLYPFYYDLLQANGSFPYSIVALSDNVVISIARLQDGGIFVELENIATSQTTILDQTDTVPNATQ
ncbi:hypothetical protein [Cohaesibacter celericrescens]|uniref:Uncharacterized protein n=1 Tax=Cohaesibacter celericrescens TaxID=2067669 RepID=A0A2N5XLE9_9HYPH|nr:hypothetical protein [Cohaesibacter celericrescens]PLW75339.1 hypothetical protein C0081_19910 [Cohaesibacter celericrescens]